MKDIKSRSSSPRSTSTEYAEAVPSVLRAVEVIEHLQKSSIPLNLTELSRALGISPSSLSAILRTLASRGYVARDETTARYRLGPALSSLATESTTQLSIREAAESVAALAQAAVNGSEAETSVSRRRNVLLALGSAGRHLSDLLLADAMREMPAEALPDPVWRAEASGPLTSTELDLFLGGALIATLSCVKDDGYPYSVPVWYQWEDEHFWVVPRRRAEWARHLERNPRVSLVISEQSPPFRRVLIEGKAEPVVDPGNGERARELTVLMAQRYLRSSADAYLEAAVSQEHRVFAIAPEKLVTWHGLASHPRYHASEPSVIDNPGVA